MIYGQDGIKRIVPIFGIGSIRQDKERIIIIWEVVFDKMNVIYGCLQQ